MGLLEEKGKNDVYNMGLLEEKGKNDVYNMSYLIINFL
jgi:hypothetical protein